MTDINDKFLEKEENISVDKTGLLPFERPENFFNFSDDTFKMVSLYMTIVISKASPHREVDVSKTLNNAKNMFRNGVRYNDDLWLKHCAASVREIIMFVEPSHFEEAYQSIKLVDPEVEYILNFIKKTTTYLSSIVHSYGFSTIIGNANALYPAEKYGEKSKEEFKKIENELFEKVCIDMVLTLHHLFSKYCTNNE